MNSFPFQTAQTEEEIHHPSIIFKLQNALYSINSKHVESILSVPNYEKIPNAPNNIIGVFAFRTGMIQILDLRAMLGKVSLQSELTDFQQMIAARRQDHINWVNELERTTQSGETFTLTNNPHKCALGKWYDQFTSDNKGVMFYLKKMEEPHRLLHASIDEIERSKEIADPKARARKQAFILRCARTEYMPKVIQSLEKALDSFQTSVNQAIILVLKDESGEHHIGLMVDEVLAVESFLPSTVQYAFQSIQKSPYIRGIGKCEKVAGDILEIDAASVISSVIHAPAEED